jgi:hypothetical protein
VASLAIIDFDEVKTGELNLEEAVNRGACEDEQLNDRGRSKIRSWHLVLGI